VYVFHFGDFELDLSRYELRRDGCEIEIGPRNFDVLAYLLRNPDRLVSKNELIERVWGGSAMSWSENIDTASSG
jgi:DNA-binding winged helix-turn-helix (wHTH) protein